MTPGRWIALVALLVAGAFAYWGGSFSEPNYRELRQHEADSMRLARALEREVDSLRIFRDSLATNPVVQERVARQEFGMLRPGELTVMILFADSARKDSARAKGRLP